VMLKLDHLGEDVIQQRLPGIRQTCITFLGIDPAEAPIPVFPTAHYTMGGIPTNRHGQVVAPVKDTPEEPVPGLYAAGECACVSVHGANRLGGNSLLDILVFGRAAANHIIDYLKENRYHRAMDEASLESAVNRFTRWDQGIPASGKIESVSGLREELKTVMEDHCGVFRNDEVLSEGIAKVEALLKRFENVRIADHSGTFNTARVEALELENLMGCALATIHSAHARTESRGAHSRIDHTERDDIHWMRHSLYSLEGGLDYKPVRTKPMSVDSFPPKARTY
jgi:succinate dehydrogenase / fumarate reductase flavoprotein subunit